jgi:hypothetical protein
MERAVADAADQGWLDALAGRPAGTEGALASVKEGAVVREAMLAHRRTPPRFDADAGLRRLWKRLHAEKLLERPRFASGWRIPAIAAVAALAIVFVLALREQPRRGPRAPPAPEVPVLSGDPNAAQTIETADAREIADELQTMMTQAGLTPKVTQVGALTRLEADWPRRPSEAQIQFLRDYGFARPNGPALKVEVRLPQE